MSERADQEHGAAPHGSPHGSRRGYLTGFGLSVLLTAIPFWLVMSGAAGPLATGIAIFACAAVQIVVHVIFFLHLDTRSEGGWNLISFVFTVVVVVIVLGGSLWIMYHLNSNLMAGMPSG